jgi:O-antigen/teichoic acid export membrane protein
MAWLLAGAILVRALWLVASIIVVRLLGRMDFGQLGMIQNTLGLFGVFAGFGLGITATKHIAEYRIKDPDKAGRIMALSNLAVLAPAMAASLALFFWAPWLAERTLAAPHLARLLRVGAAVMFFNTLNGSQLGALAGLERFQTISRLNMITTAAATLIQVGAVYCYGLEGAVWGLVAAAAINWTLSHWILRKEAARNAVPFSYSGCLREWPILWKFSLPAAVSGMLCVPVQWACRAMIVNQSQGYAEMGMFSAAYQWHAAILFIPATISVAVIPMLANLRGQNDETRYNKILRCNLLLNGALASAIAITVILLSPWIMAAYGEAFSASYAVLILLALVAIIVSVANVIGHAIASDGKMWMGMILNLVWSVVVLLCSWRWRRDGAWGLAAANLVAYGVHLFSVSIYLYYRGRSGVARRLAPEAETTSTGANVAKRGLPTEGRVAA